MSGLARIGILLALIAGLATASSQFVTTSAGTLVGDTLSITQGATVTLSFEDPTLIDGWKVEVAGVLPPGAVIVRQSRTLVTLTITNVQPIHNVPEGYGYGLSPISPSGSGTSDNPQSTKSGEIRLRVILPKRLGVPVKVTDSTLRLSIRAADGTTPLLVTDGQFMEVWSTTNLLSTNWVVISGSVSATNGVLYLNDTGASNFTRRFYRIIDR